MSFEFLSSMGEYIIIKYIKILQKRVENYYISVITYLVEYKHYN